MSEHDNRPIPTEAICHKGIRHVAGPDVFRLDELGRITLAARRDGRPVITDEQAGLFAAVTGDELVAGRDAADVALSTLMTGVALEPMHYQDWVQKKSR
jgi:hypothetical protein